MPNPAKLPAVSSDQVIRAFEKLGYRVVPGGKGSHTKLKRPGNPTLIIPRARVVRAGTLRSLIRTAGLSVEALTAALG